MLLIVLGMGRSGTSLLMQVLQEAGFDCGSDFISTNPNNLKGYYERLPVMNFNKALLEAAGGEFEALFPLPSIEQIEALIGNKTPPVQFPQHDYAVKDPRFSLTLPVWLPYLQNYDLRVVLTHRDESAIAESLFRAYGMDMEAGRAITGEYLRRAQWLIDHYSLKSVEVHYEDWFHNPQRNLRRLEYLIERPVQVDIHRILHPELRHCKGRTLLDELKDQCAFPEPYRTIGRDNMIGIEHLHHELVAELRPCLAGHHWQIYEASGERVTVEAIAIDSQARYTFTFPKRPSSDFPPYNRYRAYNPKRQWLVIYGLSAFNPEGLDEHKLTPLSPIAVIDPDPLRAAALLNLWPVQNYLRREHVYWYIGRDAGERFLDGLNGELKPYLIFCKSLHFIAEPAEQAKPEFQTFFQCIQHQFRQSLQEVTQVAKRFAEKYTKISNKKETAMLVIPSVSCWLNIGHGLAKAFRDLGYEVIDYAISFPPASASVYECLNLLWRLYQCRPDFLLTVSHSSDLLIQGIKEIPIPRIVWYVDHPDHLMQAAHNPYDKIIVCWREFEEPLAQRGAAVKGEVPIGSAPMAAAFDEALQCQVGFVGSVSNTGKYRETMSAALVQKIDRLVEAKLNAVKMPLVRLMQACEITSGERERMANIAAAMLPGHNMSVEQLITYYLHIECIRARRVQVLTALAEFDLKIFGSGDWAPLLKGTALERAYQGRGLLEEDCRHFYRSAQISLNIHPPFLHSGPMSRDMDIPMCGGFVLSDIHLHAEERLGEFFEPGSEIITYDGPQDLAAKVRYYLDHPDERQAITEAAQQRILRQHTYRHRVRQMQTLLGI